LHSILGEHRQRCKARIQFHKLQRRDNSRSNVTRQRVARKRHCTHVTQVDS
jgi:hypothetical protein